MGKNKFYAVAKGHRTGIFHSWSICEAQVKGYPGARYKSFPTEHEAKAYLNSSNHISTTSSHSHNQNSTTVVQKTQNDTTTSKKKQQQSTQMSLLTSFSHHHHPHKKRKRSNTTIFYQIIIQFDGGSRGNPGRSGSGAVVQIKSNTTPTTKTTTTTKVTTTTTTTDTSSTISTSQTWYARSFLPQNATNNEAEYNGVLVGLTIAARELKKLTTVSQHNNGNDNKNNNNNNKNSSSRSNNSSRSSKSSVKIKNEDKERPYVELILQGDSKLVIQQLQRAWKVNKDSLKPYYNEAMRLIEQEIQPDKCQFLHVYREENRLADQLANEAMDTGRSWYTTSDDNHEQEMPLSFWMETSKEEICKDSNHK